MMKINFSKSLAEHVNCRILMFGEENCALKSYLPKGIKIPDGEQGILHFIDVRGCCQIFVPLDEKKHYPFKLREELHKALGIAKRHQQSHLAIGLYGTRKYISASRLVRLCTYELILANYRFEKYRGNSKPVSEIMECSIYLDDFDIKNDGSSVDSLSYITTLAQAQMKGVALARDLANTPPNICYPGWLAEQAQKLATQYNKLECTVLKEAELIREKMSAILAVGRGSQHTPRLIVINYRGAEKNEAPTVLIGKGVTFDSGGISLKPAAKMDEMKYDMCGAASVMGSICTVAEMKAKINLIAIVPSVENMPGCGAYRPGDIITTRCGKTVEVLNTDAEGRLILADALDYAQGFRPARIIDIATLTGACVVALGHHKSAFFSNSDMLSQALEEAAEKSFDAIWRMPLGEDYNEQLKSNFADFANIGGPSGGIITAACFLQRFVAKNTPWAHLDIAGTAWITGDKKNATGRPVPLLTQYLFDNAEK